MNFDEIDVIVNLMLPDTYKKKYCHRDQSKTGFTPYTRDSLVGYEFAFLEPEYVLIVYSYGMDTPYLAFKENGEYQYTDNWHECYKRAKGVR